MIVFQKVSSTIIFIKNKKEFIFKTYQHKSQKISKYGLFAKKQKKISFLSNNLLKNYGMERMNLFKKSYFNKW